MALLYEKSKSWRLIVHATKDRRILALFSGVCVASATWLAWAAQSMTDGSSQEARKELEELKRRDMESVRYANHSKEALATLFEQVQPGGDSASARVVADSMKAGKPPIKLPEVAWHPKAVARADSRKPADRSANE